MDMERLRIKVWEAAERIKIRTGVAGPVIDRAASCLIKRLDGKAAPKLLNDEVKLIGNELVIGGQSSYQTWLHRDCFNGLIHDLRARRLIESPYFNIPQQVRRHLVTSIEREVWADFPYVQAIRQELLALRIARYSNLFEEEVDCVCSFIAAAALFGKILFPGFERILLGSKWQNVSLSPVALEVYIRRDAVDDNDAFYRYYLPAPVSLYFLRAVLFYRKNRNRYGLKRRFDPESYVFQPMQDRLETFSSLFKKWICNKLERISKMQGGLAPSRFREAALLYSLVEQRLDNQKFKACPPFVLAVHARAVESDSFRQEYLHGPDFTIKATQNTKERAGAGNSFEGKDPLEAILEEMRKRISKLSKNSGLNERNRCGELIKSVALSDRFALSEEDRQNIKLFSEWIAQMLCPTRTKQRRIAIKSIRNYISGTAHLMRHLSQKGYIGSLSSGELTNVLKQTMDRFDSKSIRNALKNFTDFLEAVLGKSFDAPNWKSNDLWKEDRPKQKPLIYEKHVEQALKERQVFFTRYLANKIEKRDYDTKLRQALYKSEIIYHMINLGFYAGVRASEFAHLKVHNVIYDNGVILCIRTSKTRNGIRNIPLSLLAPDYLVDFIEYHERRVYESRGVEQLLFPNYNGKVWDTSFLASEVSRLFKSIGLEGIRFHYLRHSFANWFLMRWFAAFHPDFRSKLPPRPAKLFWKESLNEIKELALGMGKKAGQDIFSHGLAVLARLIGHGGPLVTLQKYIHSVDQLFYFITESSSEEKVAISCEQAQEFLQVSYPSLPEDFRGRGRKTVAFDDILRHQQIQLIKDEENDEEDAEALEE